MTSLGEVLAQLGEEVLTALVESDAAIGTVVVTELGDELPPARNGLLLVPGLAEHPDEAAEFLANAAGAGAVGVVVKRRGAAADELASISAAARANGLGLFLAPDRVPWHQLLELLETAHRSTDSAASSVALGDLFGLANAVAALTGGATAIEDATLRLLAYSNLPGQEIDDMRRTGILGRRAAAHESGDAVYRDLYRSRGVRRFHGEGNLPRLAIAVRAGTDVLGSLWIVDGGKLSPDVEAALESASELAALHLLRARTGADVERRARGDTLRDLIDGRIDADAAADRLGIAITGAHLFLAVRILEAQPSGDELMLERLHELVALRCAATVPAAVTTVSGEAVWALLPGEGNSDAKALTEGIIARARGAFDAQAVVALGEPGESLASIAESRIELAHILSLLSLPGSDRSVARRDDVHPALILRELRNNLDAKSRLRLRSVTEMVAYDRDQGGSYLDTLLAYFECMGDIPAAAERVSVHPNTFRYRLRRARELFAIDLDQPDQRLVLWLQISALRRQGG